MWPPAPTMLRNAAFQRAQRLAQRKTLRFAAHSAGARTGYVLHCFPEKTARPDLDLAGERYRELSKKTDK